MHVYDIGNINVTGNINDIFYATAFILVFYLFRRNFIRDFRVIVLLDLLNAYHRYIYYLRWYTSFCTVADTLQNEKYRFSGKENIVKIALKSVWA